MRKLWIGGNWKMHKTIGEAVELVRALKAGLTPSDQVEVVAAPPYTALQAVYAEIRESGLQLAAQNMHWASQGAYTGEISAAMLREVGCRWVILGHSERRQLFQETDALIRKKIKSCLEAGLEPVFCLGETLEEREAGRVEEVLSGQIREGFQELTRQDALRGVIAYEPVWAIGTGRTATPEMAQQVHAFVRALLAEIYDKDLASLKRIVYGGSLTPETTRGLLDQPDIDGGLIGGASLKPESFIAIVKECLR